MQRSTLIHRLATIALFLAAAVALAACGDDGSTSEGTNNGGNNGGFNLCTGGQPECWADCRANDVRDPVCNADNQFECPAGSTPAEDCEEPAPACGGSAEPVCLESCGSDIAQPAICTGTWTCPDGTVNSATCPPPADCEFSGQSDLEGVAINITSERCTWTTEEAQQGIEIPFQVIVDEQYMINPYRPDAGACKQPGDSGLITHGEVAGDGQHYCRCDVGLCAAHDPEWNTLQTGTYDDTFHFDAYNWQGPSDYGAEFGEPFPPGDYTLTVRSNGQRLMPNDAVEDFEVVGTMTIHLTAP